MGGKSRGLAQSLQCKRNCKERRRRYRITTEREREKGEKEIGVKSNVALGW